MSNKRANIRCLPKSAVLFTWGNKQQHAFEATKGILCHELILLSYDGQAKRNELPSVWRQLWGGRTACFSQPLPVGTSVRP